MLGPRYISLVLKKAFAPIAFIGLLSYTSDLCSLWEWKTSGSTYSIRRNAKWAFIPWPIFWMSLYFYWSIEISLTYWAFKFTDINKHETLVAKAHIILIQKHQMDQPQNWVYCKHQHFEIPKICIYGISECHYTMRKTYGFTLCRPFWYLAKLLPTNTSAKRDLELNLGRKWSIRIIWWTVKTPVPTKGANEFLPHVVDQHGKFLMYRTVSRLCRQIISSERKSDLRFYWKSGERIGLT